MKRKLLSLFLLLAISASLILTSCGGSSSDDDNDDTSYVANSPITLSIYSITDESTTDEAIKLVQDAMNEYTENRYNTHIELHLYTEDEYYGVLDEKLEKGSGRQPAAEEGSKYPGEAENQCDIFLVTNFDKLSEYAENKYTSDVGIYLENDYKLINKYINESLMNAASINWVKSWLPNNSIIGGEYTYLLVNRALMEKYYYSESDVSSLSGLDEFVTRIAANEPGYIPVYNEPADLTQPLNDSISIIGAFVANSASQSTLTTPKVRLDVGQYKSRETTLCKWYSSGMITVGNDYALPEGQNVAAAFIKGEYNFAEKYEDEYCVITYRKPVASSTNMYSSGYCINSASKDTGRCMEILADLATKSTLCNIFQYGVEGIHYEVDDLTGIYNIISDDYSMDLKNTGNMFLLKQSDKMDEQMLAYSENNWALAKAKNLDTVVSPWAAFSITKIDKETEPDYQFIYSDELISNLERISTEYIQNVKNYEARAAAGENVDMASYLSTLTAELMQNKYIKDALNADNPRSLLSQYNSYYEVTFATQQ